MALSDIKIKALKQQVQNYGASNTALLVKKNCYPWVDILM